MFIDIHVHPAFFEPINLEPKITEFRHKALDIQKNGLAPLEHIFNQMECAGLDKLTLLPEDYTTIEGGIVVSNEEIKKLVDTAPDRFIGFAAVDPFVKGHLDAIEKAFTELKLKGLKLHPSKQHFYPSDKSLEPLYKICEKYDKPILFHSGVSWEPNTLSKYSRPIEFEELALNHPKLRICLAHFGWPYVQETAMLMLKFPNIYADTALLYFDSAREFYKRVFTEDIPSTWIDRSLRHQVMFGSNNPRFEQIRMAEAIEHLGFRESTLELIKGQNALEFIGGI
ncbi:amidohydrolase family protein [Clostridium manihotivorum]|uniref:Amidohydrolase n=1 Tax=Clostridium manihotivorum TaxID=2320868 RepID=A0A3R5QVU4_9CLOT|nr:amidohydrolase family protein [Clostridium manihotivorum]QAA33439.1 amidohydrolase [Clostridium manihotivorum]